MALIPYKSTFVDEMDLGDGEIDDWVDTALSGSRDFVKELLEIGEESLEFSAAEDELRKLQSKLNDAEMKESQLKQELQVKDKMISRLEDSLDQLKKELLEERARARDEAEDMAQELAELRYQMSETLEEERMLRARTEQVSVHRVEELENQVKLAREEAVVALAHRREAELRAEKEVKELQGVLEATRQQLEDAQNALNQERVCEKCPLYLDEAERLKAELSELTIKLQQQEEEALVLREKLQRSTEYQTCESSEIPECRELEVLVDAAEISSGDREDSEQVHCEEQPETLELTISETAAHEQITSDTPVFGEREEKEEEEVLAGNNEPEESTGELASDTPVFGEREEEEEVLAGNNEPEESTGEPASLTTEEKEQEQEMVGDAGAEEESLNSGAQASGEEESMEVAAEKLEDPSLVFGEQDENVADEDGAEEPGLRTEEPASLRVEEQEQETAGDRELQEPSSTVENPRSGEEAGDNGADEPGFTGEKQEQEGTKAGGAEEASPSAAENMSSGQEEQEQQVLGLSGGDTSAEGEQNEESLPGDFAVGNAGLTPEELPEEQNNGENEVEKPGLTLEELPDGEENEENEVLTSEVRSPEEQENEVELKNEEHEVEESCLTTEDSSSEPEEESSPEERTELTTGPVGFIQSHTQEFYSTQIEILEQKISQVQASEVQLELERSDLLSEVAELKKQVEHFRLELELSVQRHSEALMRLNNERTLLEEETQAAKAALSGEIAQLQEAVEGKGIENESVRRELAEYHSNLEKENDRAEELAARIKALEAELQSERVLYSEAASKCVDLSLSLDKTTQKLLTVEAELEVSRNENEALQKSLEVAENQLLESTREKHLVEEDLQRLRGQLQAQEQRGNRLQQELVCYKSSNNQLASKVGELNSEVLLLQQRLITCQTQVSEMAMKNVILEDTVAAKKRKIKEGEQRMIQQAEKMGRQEEKYFGLQAKFSALQNDFSALEGKLSETRRREQEIRIQMERLSLELSMAKQEVVNSEVRLQKAVKHAKEQLEAENARHEELVNKYRQTEWFLNRKIEHLERSELEKEQLQQEIWRLRSIRN